MEQQPAHDTPEDREAAARRRFRIETAAVVVGYLATVGAGATAGWPQAALLLVGATAVAVPVAVKYRREVNREQRWNAAERLVAEADTRLATALGDYVAPIADLLGALAGADAGQVEGLRSRLTQAVVEAAAKLCGPERTRAVLFELDGDVLAPGPWTGRGDAPSTVFRRGADARGDLAHALVTQRDYLLVEDVRDRPLPPGVEVSTRVPYRSFLSVSVATGDAAFGMLSVDAPEPGTIDDADLQVARALANLLAAGLAMRTPSP